MGCGVAALVVVIAFVGIFLYIQKRPTVLTDLLMKQVESHYAVDVPEEEKVALRSAYADFRRAVEAKRMNERGFDRIQSSARSAVRSSTISREQVREMTEAFRAAAGGPAPSPRSTPRLPDGP